MKHETWPNGTVVRFKKVFSRTEADREARYVVRQPADEMNSIFIKQLNTEKPHYRRVFTCMLEEVTK